ncbi:MAG: transglycosylase domain-containing protein [Dorea sp.]|nr:transglycosylase domain-containing protein [Dorea sp.]
MIRKHKIRKVLLWLFTVLFCIAALTGTFFGIKGYRMYREATAEKSIEETMEEIRGREHFTKYSELPQFYIDAVISVEDHRFEKHPGIDLIAVCRAAWVDIRSCSFREGGSTITQQLVKNQIFTQEKILERKAAEVFAVFDVEGKYAKEEIFELYVNTISFGGGYEGIYEASIGYFGKVPSELSDCESVILAGLPNAPSAYSPNTNMKLVIQRSKQVLNSMVRNHIITQEKADEIQRLLPLYLNNC